MPTPVDALKDKTREAITIDLPYGRHVGAGALVMAWSDELADGKHTNKIRQALCESTIAEVESVYYDAIGIPPAQYTVYDGTQQSAPAAPFERDQPHFGTVMLDVTLNMGQGAQYPEDDLPEQIAVFGKFGKIQNYDSSGAALGTSYSPNPARVAADIIHRKSSEPLGTTDWAAWCAWRDYTGASETQNYSALTDQEGIGISSKIYSGTDFGTLVIERLDQTIDADLREGAPAHGISPDNYSIKWEGKIRAKQAGSYTFTLEHDDGAVLYVGSLVTPLINEWTAPGTHSATITLEAHKLYDFRLDFFEASGTAKCSLTWTPPGEESQIIHRQYLYPAPQTNARFEAHALFDSPQTPEDAVRQVLLMSNSTVQQADGKRRFFCIEQLTEPTFHFNETNIKEDSFEFYPRDRRDVPNRFTGVFRDLNSQYLKVADPPVTYDCQTIQDETEMIASTSVELDNMTHFQAQKVIRHLARLQAEEEMLCTFDGTKMTYPVLPGDLVTVTHPSPDWFYKTFLVLEAIDYSPETTPDRRRFTCIEWATSEYFPPENLTDDATDEPLEDDDTAQLLTDG